MLHSVSLGLILFRCLPAAISWSDNIRRNQTKLKNPSDCPIPLPVCQTKQDFLQNFLKQFEFRMKRKIPQIITFSHKYKSTFFKCHQDENIPNQCLKTQANNQTVEITSLKLQWNSGPKCTPKIEKRKPKIFSKKKWTKKESMLKKHFNRLTRAASLYPPTYVFSHWLLWNLPSFNHHRRHPHTHEATSFSLTPRLPRSI